MGTLKGREMVCEVICIKMAHTVHTEKSNKVILSDLTQDV